MVTKSPSPVPFPADASTTRGYSAPSVASPTHYLQFEGGRIAYEDTGGAGPLVIAIPGMGDLRSEYRLLRPRLQAEGYRVVTMDVRGHGESSAQWGDYSAHAVARDALAMIEHLKAGPAVILGNSFAAGSALWAAHDAPAQVGGVVLLGPIVHDLKAPWYAKLIMKIGFGGPWNVWFWTTYWTSLFPTNKPADINQVKAAITKNLREPGRMAALKAMLDKSKADTAAIVSQSRVPALVVMGTRDPDFPDPTAEATWLTSELHAESLIVEGAGHYPHVEMPEQIMPTLLSFIAKSHAEASAITASLI